MSVTHPLYHATADDYACLDAVVVNTDLPRVFHPHATGAL